MDHDVGGIALSVSSILSGSSAFLLGFYLSEFARGTEMKKIRIFRTLVIIITIPSLIIGILMIALIANHITNTENDSVLIISALASMVPSSSFLILLLVFRR